MAIKENDSLAVYLGDEDISQRFDNWLFIYLVGNDQNSQLAAMVGGVQKNGLRSLMLEEIKRQNISPQDVILKRASLLLHQGAFDWFENTKRFCRWFCTWFYNSNGGIPVFAVANNILGLNNKDQCILVVDSAFISKKQKVDTLLNAKVKWSQRKIIGQRFDWVDGNNEAQSVEQAILAVKEFRPYSLLIEQPESYEDLLIAIDYFDLNEQEAKSASERARRKLTQIKYRSESKTKKQLNVLIDIKCMNTLESICQKNGLSKAKVIELLINTENEKNSYITEKKAAWFRGDVV